MPRLEARTSDTPPGERWLLHSFWLCVAVAVLVSGCSRLTFVRPDLSDGDYRQVAPDYEVAEYHGGRQSSRALILARQGQQALDAGDLQAASDAGRAALEIDPQSAPAHRLMAVVETRLGHPERVGEHLLAATESYPRGSSFNNYGSWMCQQPGRAAESLQWFDRALADPGYQTPAFAMANAGACADKAGDTARADLYLQAALQADPDNPVALGMMAERAYRAGDPFKARAFSQRRLAAAAADPHALMLASQIELALGDKAASDRYVQRLKTEFPAAADSGTGESGRP